MKKATQREHIATASARNARVAPRKARLVIDQIRGMNVAQALAVLDNTRRGSNPIVYKVLQSAIANAVQKDGNVDPDGLIVTEARVDQARVLKRMRPRAMGRGALILKKSSHISLSVG